ncbi:ROK family transcriptional regulator [uncultured Limosilactobacillus sp.]|uniref:ROK family transcriptional regulator n=1 Tax=uncultured Limosilactobacillus sp. TaxID=2837629 RepID=UPI002600B36E|nr:ROK family transcriptional regulator [uncultured Limosilactobacillus sp.]
MRKSNIELIIGFKEVFDLKNTENRDLTRSNNLKLVMQQLFNHDESSRAEIARKLGMSRSTISSLFNELDEQGYIKHLGRGGSSVVGGRKPEMVQLNSHYGFIASFNITHAHLYAGFFYLNGEKILYQRKNILEHHNILELLATMSGYLDEAIANDDTVHGLLGIGISMHAVIDNGEVIDSPFVKMDGISIRDYFTAKYSIPVIVENEANLAAIFERDFDVDAPVSGNMVVLSIHQGLGTGIIANGHLFTGFHGMAGELGRAQIYSRDGHRLQQVSRIISEDVLIADLASAGSLDKIDYSNIAQICKHPTTEVEKVLDEFADNMGLLLNNALMIYGPQKIYISCNVMELIPLLQKKIKQSFGSYNQNVSVEFVVGARYISMLGAAAIVTREALKLQDFKLHFRWPLEFSKNESEQ